MSITKSAAPTLTLWQKLSIAWLVGVLCVLIVMIVLHVRMRRRVRRDCQDADDEMQRELCHCCTQMGVKRVPELWITQTVQAPAVFGLVRPAILLPVDLEVDSASLRLVLLHELAHLRRRDLWVQVVASLVVAMHWFNPLAWWASRRLRAEAELAADACVLRLTEPEEAHRLGQVLLSFASRAAAGWALWFSAATMLSIAEGRHDLRCRIDAIVDFSRGRRAWWIVGMIAFVMLAITGLTTAPAEEVKPALPPSSTVTGIVVDDAGKPIHGASAFLSIGDTRDREVRKFITDEEGRFRFVGVPDKTDLVAWARHDEFMDIKLPNPKFTSEDKGERRIVLARVKRWLSGTVTRKADGSPVKDATIYATQASRGGIDHHALLSPRRQVKTDEFGHYRLAAWDSETTEVSMAVEASQAQIKTGRLNWKDAEQRIDFSLVSDSIIEGRVVDHRGNSVAGARLCLGQGMLSFSFLKYLNRADNGYQNIVSYYWMGEPETNAKGEFSSRWIGSDPETGEEWLVVTHPEAGFKRVKVNGWKNGDTVRLERWCVLEGQVVDQEGQPVKGAAIQSMVSDHDEGDAGGSRGFSLLDLQDTKSDERGHYRIDRLLPNARYLHFTINKDISIPQDYDLILKSGETKHYNLRIPAPRMVIPTSQLRAVAGQVRAPKGHTLKSENFSVEVRLHNEGSALTESVVTDNEGRFTTKPLEPGHWQVRVWLKPKDPKLTYAENAGVAMRVLIEPTDKRAGSHAASESRTPLEAATQTPQDVGELTVSPEDFVFRSVSDAAKGKNWFLTKVKMNAPVRDAASFATWTAGDGRTIAPEQSFTADGRIQSAIAPGLDGQFIVRAIGLDGSRWFSGALSAPDDPDTEFSSELTLNASVDVEGKVHGLADSYDGGGWIVATVFVPTAEKIGTTIKGSRSWATAWCAWSPVPKDGQFRFKGLPRGRLQISGYGKTWCTVSLDGYGSQSEVNLIKAGPVTKLNLDIRPTRVQQIKVSRPDGTPATGATISLQTNRVSGVNHALAVRNHSVEPEFKEAYERYKNVTFPKHRATADKEGVATLGELPGESCYVFVKWLDADDKTSHSESVWMGLPIKPKPLAEVKLTGKGS